MNCLTRAIVPLFLLPNALDIDRIKYKDTERDRIQIQQKHLGNLSHIYSDSRSEIYMILKFNSAELMLQRHMLLCYLKTRLYWKAGNSDK